MLEDKLLLWRFKCGNRDAFRSIYEKYAGDLLTLAGNLLGDGSAAEDVVQDVFIAFVKSAEQVQLRGSLRGYLVTCVLNRARDYMRKKKRQRTVSLSEADEVTSGRKGPVQLVVCNEELKRVCRAMTRLPYEQREVLVLHLHGELRFREIAKLQNVSVKTALSRYRYGLDKLRSILNGEVRK